MDNSMFNFSFNGTSKKTLPKTLLSLCLLVGVLTACDKQEMSGSETTPANSNLDRANPAAVYCVDQGGEYVLDSGLCKLPSGETISAWELYRNRDQS